MLQQVACPAPLEAGHTLAPRFAPAALLVRRVQLPACRLTRVILLLEGRSPDALLAMPRQAACPARLVVGRMPERRFAQNVPLARRVQLPAFRLTLVILLLEGC